MQRVSQSVTVCLKDNTVCALPVPLISPALGGSSCVQEQG